MKRIVILPIILVLIFTAASSISTKSVYDYDLVDISGNKVPLASYKGNVMLIVNVASKCGLTPHYKGLQEIYQKYKDRGFVVLGFPCNQFGAQEPGSEKEIKDFCQTSYGVTFPMFSKIDVNGENADALYKYLTKISGETVDIKWNFTKFLIDKYGNVFKRYEPKTQPSELKADIEKLLNANIDDGKNSKSLKNN